MLRMLRPQLLEAGDDARAFADVAQGQAGDQQPAQHQQRHLHDVGQRHGLQPAV